MLYDDDIERMRKAESLSKHDIERLIDAVVDYRKSYLAELKTGNDLRAREIKTDADGFMNFGCANGWGENLARKLILDRCRDSGHSRRDVDVGPPNRGLDHRVSCSLCKYRYWYDSSD